MAPLSCLGLQCSTPPARRGGAGHHCHPQNPNHGEGTLNSNPSAPQASNAPRRLPGGVGQGWASSHEIQPTGWVSPPSPTSEDPVIQTIGCARVACQAPVHSGMPSQGDRARRDNPSPPATGRREFAALNPNPVQAVCPGAACQAATRARGVPPLRDPARRDHMPLQPRARGNPGRSTRTHQAFQAMGTRRRWNGARPGECHPHSSPARRDHLSRQPAAVRNPGRSTEPTLHPATAKISPKSQPSTTPLQDRPRSDMGRLERTCAQRDPHGATCEH